jgi:predicted nucleic acid-binding protein
VAKLGDRITIVPRAALLVDLHYAARVMREIDPDDAMFIAAAFTVPGATVVSNDPHVHDQNEVETMWMTEFVEQTLGSENEDEGQWD